MILVSDIEGLPIAVMGLGVSGLATARALAASGAEVHAWDDGEASRDAARSEGIPVSDLADCDWDRIRTLVLSPGIPHLHPSPHPVAAAARSADAEIICDIELLGRAERRARFIGITGTNGKSTTTALIGDILTAAGTDMQIGGNLGPPVLGLDPVGPGGAYVLEMSSFQLERTRSIAFEVAVLLNISADHLERHGGLDGYIEAKRTIFRGQRDGMTAVIGIDDEHARRVRDELVRDGVQRVISISSEEPVRGGVYALDGVLYDNIDANNEIVADLRDVPSLPGRHNWQNAAAAYAAAIAAGVDRAPAVAAIRAFKGLPHRQEIVAVIDGITYINDSKATNADAAARALGCYPRIYWIAGGLAKADGIAPLAPYFPRIVHAFLVGESAEAFAATLGGNVPHSLSGTLDTAVAAACKMAANDADPQKGVVLLSPACASYDQFPNFGARGDAFRALVEALPGARARGDAA